MSDKSDWSRLSSAAALVGRRSELYQMRACLRARGKRHFVYLYAGGGLGKTRLLQELQELVDEAGRGYYTSRIIDLYHTNLHTTSDIERAIVEGLDPKRRQFSEYRAKRRRFAQLRERGADPGQLEKLREDLGNAFVRGCNELAAGANKVVICLDTIELLQYESSVVEELAGPEARDARIKPWLLDKLAQLENVLVVLAGRPRAAASDASPAPGATLLADLQAAFGPDLILIELQPFDLVEAREFLQAVKPGLVGSLISEQQLRVIHLLTGGRPILLYMIADLLDVLSIEVGALLRLFDGYRHLQPGDPGLPAARRAIEVELLRGIFNDPQLGFYLTSMAVMPKGVDAEILQAALGLPQGEAEKILAERLASLAIIKRFLPPPGGQPLYGDRYFLHDEVYRLLTLSGAVPNLALREIEIAKGLVANYYDRRLADLAKEIASDETDEERRIELRERLQKVQVERMYYLLVCDPRRGYQEYQRLTEEANVRRWVGFSMRLLDEFLRFHNDPRRRTALDNAGLTPARVTGDSALLWVERFQQWGKRQSAIQLADCILADPAAVSLDRLADAGILGNIRGLAAMARAILSGRYEQETVQRALRDLRALPELEQCTPQQALARARLHMAIGYHRRLGELFSQATADYAASKAAFEQAGGHQAEYASLLNNLSYVYAMQGRFVQARILAHEALRINEELGYEYARGLTLIVLSNAARLRDNFTRAQEYASEALWLFQQLGDPHGIVQAHEALAKAERQQAQHSRRLQRERNEADRLFRSAREHLHDALAALEAAGLGADRYLPIYAEFGRLYRDMGDLARQAGDVEEAAAWYTLAREELAKVLAGTLPHFGRADTLQDLAEVHYASGDAGAAERALQEAEGLISPQPGEDAAKERFLLLGKVALLRGRMALDAGHLAEGAEQYLQAHVNYSHFSAEAMQRETLLDDLFAHLRQRPRADRLSVVEQITALAGQSRGVDLAPFLTSIREVLL